MFARFAGLLLAGSLIAAAPTVTVAQTQQAPLQDRWPAPSQELQTRTPSVAPPPISAPQPTPVQQTQSPARAPAPDPDDADDDTPDGETSPPAPAAARTTPAPSPKPTQRAKKTLPGPPTVVSCSGLFGPDSSHQAIEEAFKAQNVTFGEIEGGSEGNKLVGSVIFPNDPKRRLEVLWQDEGQRMFVRLIVITGRSAWSGPKGLRLGLNLPAVEKINGKPFTLSAIDQDGAVTVTDWQGGTLASLSGNCAASIRFKIDAKASEQARAAAGAEEFTSADKALRAVKPSAVEILFGYSEAR